MCDPKNFAAGTKAAELEHLRAERELHKRKLKRVYSNLKKRRPKSLALAGRDVGMLDGIDLALLELTNAFECLRED